MVRSAFVGLYCLKTPDAVVKFPKECIPLVDQVTGELGTLPLKLTVFTSENGVEGQTKAGRFVAHNFAFVVPVVCPPPGVEDQNPWLLSNALKIFAWSMNGRIAVPQL